MKVGKDMLELNDVTGKLHAMEPVKFMVGFTMKREDFLPRIWIQ